MKKVLYFLFFYLIFLPISANEEIMLLKTKYGDVKIELFSDVAPNHVKRITELVPYPWFSNHWFFHSFMCVTKNFTY